MLNGVNCKSAERSGAKHLVSGGSRSFVAQATARIFRVVIGLYLFLFPSSISTLPFAIPKENVTFAAVFQNPVVRDIIY
jgi:hypothetical protein